MAQIEREKKVYRSFALVRTHLATLDTILREIEEEEKMLTLPTRNHTQKCVVTSMEMHKKGDAENNTLNTSHSHKIRSISEMPAGN